MLFLRKGLRELRFDSDIRYQFSHGGYTCEEGVITIYYYIYIIIYYYIYNIYIIYIIIYNKLFDTDVCLASNKTDI